MPQTVPYRYLGSFRLILALLVLLQHALPGLAPPVLRDALLPMQVGSTAVLLFFVLSGFIVVEAADRVYAGRPFAFISNRMIRIYPTYLLALAMMAGSIWLLRAAGQGANVDTVLNTKTDLSLDNAFFNLFAILPGSNGMFSMTGWSAILPLAWALRIEILFYFVLFAHSAAAAHFKMPLGRLLSASGAAGLAAYALLMSSERNGALEFFPYFALGVSAYYADRDRNIKAGAFVAAALLLAGLHLGFQTSRHSIVPMFEFFGGVLALGAIIAASGTRRSTPVAVRRDRFLGDMTYPLYLTHNCGLLLAGALLPLFSSLALAGGFAASLAIAYLATVHFERRLASVRNAVRGFAIAPEPRQRLAPAKRNGRIISSRRMRA